MALKALRDIVGDAYAIDKPEALAEFTADSITTQPLTPSCIARPGNTAQVQAIVKWANETGTPLVPVSSGLPHFRGDTAPGKPGAVILDLSRMKKILHVDTRNKVAIVEPGVTYGELQAELEKAGLCAYMPLAPRASKSVVGGVMEREPMIMATHHWDSTDPLLCAEVVFGTGDKFRTGEASGPETIEEQWEWGRAQMNPFGHSHVDFQRLLSGAQGTIGIVTWASVKCCYLSQRSRSLFVTSNNISELAEFMYQPMKYRLGGKLFILNKLNLACLYGRETQEIRNLVKNLPPWVLFASFEGYGVLPQEKISFEEADFTRLAAAANLTPVEKTAGVSALEFNRLLSRPSTEPYWKTRYRGGIQEVFFLTTLDKIYDFTEGLLELAMLRRFPEENIGFYIQPIVHGTSCHCEFDLYYDPSDKTETAAAKELTALAAEKAAAMGGFFSRPYGAWKDAAYRSAAGTLEMQKKIKAIFDPKAILNPGKLGF